MTATNPSTKPPNKWREWLEALKDEAVELRVRRKVHDEYLDLLEKQKLGDRRPCNTRIADTFHRVYIDATVMAVRRQTDSNPKALSLNRLLKQLTKHCEEFTREDFVDNFLDGRDPRSDTERERLEAISILDLANKRFDELTDEPGAAYLGADRLKADRSDLKRITAKVKQHVDQRVAHHDRDPEGELPTYGDLDRAIEHLCDLFRRYSELLALSSLVQADSDH